MIRIFLLTALCLTGFPGRINAQQTAGQTDCCGEQVPGLPPVSLTGELYNPVRLPDTSTYYNRMWQQAHVFLRSGETAMNVYIRYNMLTDDLFWFEPRNRKTIRIDKESVVRFHFLNQEGDTVLSFIRLKIKPVLSADSAMVFAEEVYTGRLSLYVRHGCEPDNQELVSREGSTFVLTHYHEIPAYYLRTSNGRIAGLSGLRKKNLYALAPESRDKIRKFCNQHPALPEGRKEDLIALTRFLETLGL